MSIIDRFVYNYESLSNYIKDSIANDNKVLIAYLNLNVLHLLYKDIIFRKAYSCFHKIVFDGYYAIIWAKNVLLKKSIEQISADLFMKKIFESAVRNRWSIYVLGGSESTVGIFEKKVKSHYQEINILQHRKGYFEQETERKIINEINELKPEYCLKTKNPRKSVIRFLGLTMQMSTKDSLVTCPQ